VFLGVRVDVARKTLLYPCAKRDPDGGEAFETIRSRHVENVFVDYLCLFVVIEYGRCHTVQHTTTKLRLSDIYLLYIEIFPSDIGAGGVQRT